MNNLSSCRHCGICFSQVCYLCERCWEHFNQPNFGVNQIEGVHLFYLWLWKAENERLAQLLYDFKHSGMRLLARCLAEKIIRANVDYFTSCGSVIYPYRRPSRKDHAYLLAEALSEVLSVEKQGVLLSPVSVSYKKLGRIDRYKMRESTDTSCGYKSLRQPLFIDDILTTGATLGVVKKVVPQVQKACVLAYRAPLGG